MPQLSNRQRIEIAKRASEALHKQEQREAERKAEADKAAQLGNAQLGNQKL